MQRRVRPSQHYAYRPDMGHLHMAAGLVLVVACSSDDDGTGVGIVELGSVTNEVALTFDVPEHTLGFHVVVAVDDSAGNEQVGIAELVAPSGEVVIDDSFVVGARIPAASQSGIAAASVPQTSLTAAKPVEAGTWTITFAVPSNVPAHARVFVRTTDDGTFQGGAVDLRVYIPDGLTIADPTPQHVVTVETAPDDPAIAARIDSFYAALANLFELERGTVEYVALPSAFARIESLEERDEALRATTAPDHPVVHLVLTNELTVYGSPVWGISAGIPGTAATAGHAMSGLVVNISLGFPAAADGLTIVHELGHFMGLYHTTEQDLATYDPLDDTPECTTGMRTCPDGRNIMFSTFYGSSGGMNLTASDQQRRVVWGSPLYRALD